MRRLTDTEHLVLSAIARNGGSYCPTKDAPLAVHAITDTLKALVRKKRLFEVPDTDVPAFRLTQAGWNDAGAINAQA